jgi:two-component sensor histidine kinase
MNTLKHAFKQQENGEIFIQLSQNETTYRLIFKDSGSGFSPSNTSSFGLKLIDALSTQLSGELGVNYDNGTQYELNFKQLN